jgi:hypothetical protein
MRIGSSLVLIAVGAILKFAVTATIRARDEITSFLAVKRLWLCYVRFCGVAGQPVRGSQAASE